MAIQNPKYFELPSKYQYTKLMLNLERSGLLKHEAKTLENVDDIEELFRRYIYLICENSIKS